MEYWMTRTGENQGGAIYKAERSGHVLYFDTDDIDASIAKVRELGGKAEDSRRSRTSAGSRAVPTRRATSSASSRATSRSPRDGGRSRPRDPRGPRRLGPGRGDGPVRRSRRRGRGARVLDRRPARARLRVLVVARQGTGALASAFRAPAWMWAGGCDGAARRVLDHVRAAADRCAATIAILVGGQLAMGS